MSKFKLFDKWDISGIEVKDPGLKRYVYLSSMLVANSYGRNQKQRFGKSKTNIVERLMNKLMIPGHKGKKHYRTSGHITGKKSHAYKLVKECFEIIERDTKQNPLQVFVKALENGAPREEITSIEYGGARYSQAVDCAPQRRVDIALRQFVAGAYSKSFGKKKGMAAALAEELSKAAVIDQASQAISKKLELERQADASR